MDLRKGGGVSGRMEAWLLFGIVEGEGLGMRVDLFENKIVVGTEGFGCEQYEVGAVCSH